MVARPFLLFLKKGRAPLLKQKKPGFSDNLYVSTDILCKNPVSEPPGGLGGAIAMYATSDKSIGKVLTTLTLPIVPTSLLLHEDSFQLSK